MVLTSANAIGTEEVTTQRDMSSSGAFNKNKKLDMTGHIMVIVVKDCLYKSEIVSERNRIVSDASPEKSGRITRKIGCTVTGRAPAICRSTVLPFVRSYHPSMRLERIVSASMRTSSNGPIAEISNSSLDSKNGVPAVLTTAAEPLLLRLGGDRIGDGYTDEHICASER